MFRNSPARRAALVMLMAAPLLAVTAVGAAQAKPMKQTKATVSVFHAIPAGKGADLVDVYADDTLLFNNVQPGQLISARVPAGTYDVGVYADGQAPGTAAPLLEQTGVVVLPSASITAAAHLDAAGQPKLTVYANARDRNPAGKGRITVRHIAAAPAVDIRANGIPLFSNLVNPEHATAVVDAAPYRVDVVLHGTDTIVLGPTVVAAVRPMNTIVYAWGSAADGTLQLAIQRVKTAK